MATRAAQATVLVAGASGLVGREILRNLSADKRTRQLHCLGRRPLPAELCEGRPQLRQHQVDFARPQSFPALDGVQAVYIALGTTIAQAGSEAAFRAVDYEAVMAVAQAGLRYGATTLGVVSAMGADARSRIFYNRVKGEMEAALSALPYRSLVIARPSFLVGPRAQTDQAPRRGEPWIAASMRLLAPVIPKNYRAVTTAAVADRLVAAVQQAQPGRQVLLSGELQPR